MSYFYLGFSRFLGELGFFQVFSAGSWTQKPAKTRCFLRFSKRDSEASDGRCRVIFSYWPDFVQKCWSILCFKNSKIRVSKSINIALQKIVCFFFVFIGQNVFFFCANLLPKIVPKLTNNLLILGLIFALFFELSFVLFLYFLGCVLGFLELFWQASVAKNRDKLGVFFMF